jgi:hypothetical protein
MADLVFPGATPDTNVLNSAAMPENVNMVIYQGDYVDMLITIKNELGDAMNLTGYTAQASLKSNYDDATPIDFSCVVTPLTGQVSVYMSTLTTSALTPGDYVWDFQLTNPDDDARTYLTGDVTVYPEVTQSV